MSDFTPEHFQKLAELAKAGGETIAQGLGLCFEKSYMVEVGDPVTLPPNGERGFLNEPGLLVGIRVGTTGVVVVIPESFPLPEWYKTPDESQLSRLQTLGMEWSMSIFPEELMAEEYSANPFENLNDVLDTIEPHAEAQWISLLVMEEGAEAPFTIFLAGPVGQPCYIAPAAEPATQAEEPAETSAPAMEAEAASPQSSVDAGEGMSQEERVRRMQRVMKLTVDVSVRLADKRVELSTLMNMAPGSLIMFEKSSEDLLDLYVNNTPYCRGEVVKVGENFGLKVNEVGYHIEREARII